MSLGQLKPARAIADAHRITLEMGLDRYLWQESFVAVVNEIRGRYPDDYSGAAIIDLPTAEAWIGFKSNVPSGVSADISEVGGRVVLAAGVGFSQREMAATVRRYHQALMDHPEVLNVIAAPDHTNGIVTAEVQPRFSPSRSGEDELRQQILSNAFGPSSIELRMEFTYSDLTAKPTSHIRGGGRMENRTNPSRNCTAGFPVVHPGTGRQGVSTAGHCAAYWFDGDTVRYYESPSGNGATRLNLRNWRINSFGDFGWYGNHNATRTFYTGPASFQNLNAVRWPVAGQSICKWGITTLGDCGITVETVDDCISIFNPDLGHTVQVCNQARAAEFTDEGDSGGPWYSFTTALGMTTGFIEPMSYFTMAPALNSWGMGVKILRNGPILTPPVGGRNGG